MAKAKKKGPSVAKTLLSLIQSDPSNRTCADCRASLVDPNDVYGSFCAGYREVPHRSPAPGTDVAIHDFKLTHKEFAPPDISTDRNERAVTDPARNVNQRFGGHGVFICAKCAKAHKKIGAPITKVNAVQDTDSWTQKQAQYMQSNGGNTRSWAVYERYIPESWKNRRPNPSSLLEDRILFCRAKYEALAFIVPPPGPLSKKAWLSILKRNQVGQLFDSSILKNIYNLAPSTPASPSSRKAPNAVGAPPNRLFDFFCVVTSTPQLHPNELEKDLSNLTSPEQLNFWPQVADCYPGQASYSDMEFPKHLPSFVLPNGCHPRKTQLTPTFYTFVLTLANGDRLYGGALQIYDDTMETEQLKEAILASGYEGSLPRFVDPDDHDNTDIVFVPKCLILLSHHPFFDLFREVLLLLYQITLVEAPLPIERYVSNLIAEVPLPPKGKIKVEFGFTTQRLINIERPAINELPLANFSYRPLFASLSVGNIIVVLGCLLEECKVALLSQHLTILTPVAEALLSALFPLDWQGLYLPTMPFSMLDILDAPVPFLVGLDSRYLHEIPPQRRPKHVVFVDLDRDVILMGIDEDTDRLRKIPRLPNRDAMKLKMALEEAAGSMYLLPNSGIKGCIMEGSEDIMLIPNEDRPKFAQMQSIPIDADALGRQEVLARTHKAYDESELAAGIAGFRTVHGELKGKNESDLGATPGSPASATPPRLRKPKFMRNKQVEMLSSSLKARGQAHLLDVTDPKGFSTEAIRNAFLRFMVTVFVNYAKFIREDKKARFDEEGFLRDAKLDPVATAFLQKVLHTQMFQHFLENKKSNANDPEIRFFDESILAKLNRSAVTKMTKGGKLPTPFLDNQSWKVAQSFSPPPPSNLGLPDSGDSYHYYKFPSLDPSLFGRNRPIRVWAQERSKGSLRIRSEHSRKARANHEDILKRAMKPLVAPAAIAAAARRSARDLESALTALKDMKVLHRKDKSRKGKKKSKKNVSSSSSTLSSTSSDSLESNGPVTTLSKADTIMINARRKQSILLDIVIEMQAFCRMFMGRLKFKRTRRAVIVVQRKFRRKQEEDVLAAKTAHVVAIQRYIRGFLAYKQTQRMQKTACTVQRYARGYLSRCLRARLKASIIMIQKHIKASLARSLYAAVRNMVCKVQALARGAHVRVRVAEVIEKRMTLYREEVFSLWKLGYAPLTLRTKMWPLFVKGMSFARLRLAESELARMWRTTGTMPKPNSSFTDETTSLAAKLGLGSAVYCKCVQSVLNEKKLSDPQTPTQKVSFEIEEAERLQIHERLDALPDDEVEKIYSDFGIPAHEKMKKVTMARTMWAEYKSADKSRAAMMTLFPELQGSLSISFQSPSKKSKRRFPSARKGSAPTVTQELWDDISMEGAKKRSMQEMSSMYVTKLPSIMATLDEAEKRKRDGRKVGTPTNRSVETTPDRRGMIANFLDGRSEPSTPKGHESRHNSSQTQVHSPEKVDHVITSQSDTQVDFPNMDISSPTAGADTEESSLHGVDSPGSDPLQPAESNETTDEPESDLGFPSADISPPAKVEDDGTTTGPTIEPVDKTTDHPAGLSESSEQSPAENVELPDIETIQSGEGTPSKVEEDGTTTGPTIEPVDETTDHPAGLSESSEQSPAENVEFPDIETIQSGEGPPSKVEENGTTAGPTIEPVDKTTGHPAGLSESSEQSPAENVEFPDIEMIQSSEGPPGNPSTKSDSIETANFPDIDLSQLEQPEVPSSNAAVDFPDIEMPTSSPKEERGVTQAADMASTAGAIAAFPDIDDTR